MTSLVPPEQIEDKVGVRRHQTQHYGRAVSAEEVFYILHSQMCFDGSGDLRECAYSLALDNGLDRDPWRGLADRPVALGIHEDRLVPLTQVEWVEP